MKFFVHALDGSQSIAEIESNQTLSSFLQSNNLNGLRMVCQGSILNEENMQTELYENANVYLTADLDGGKKKKKKKVYTTKKKNKHIHKKIPNLTLSLYSVDKNGNVTENRKTCPSCSAGTFMAQHWDRYYCGLCHTTIKMDAQTIKKNEQIMKKKKAALEAEKKAKQKEMADKAPAGKGKKDAKKAKKK